MCVHIYYSDSRLHVEYVNWESDFVWVCVPLQSPSIRTPKRIMGQQALVCRKCGRSSYLSISYCWKPKAPKCVSLVPRAWWQYSGPVFAIWCLRFLKVWCACAGAGNKILPKPPRLKPLKTSAFIQVVSIIVYPGLVSATCDSPVSLMDPLGR